MNEKNILNLFWKNPDVAADKNSEETISDFRPKPAVDALLESVNMSSE